MSRRELRRVAALMAAISSTYSTLFVVAGSRQTGRDPAVDFMQVGTVPLRGRAIRREPPPGGVLAGVASHQGADVLWAWIFFRHLLPRSPLPPWLTIAAGQLPWAFATAAAEYWVFLPWVQPWLRMQVPYWTASGVHVSSALAYGLHPWVAGDRSHAGRRFAAATAAAMAAAVGVPAVITWLDRAGRSPRWPGVADGVASPEGRFLYEMTGHHRTGLLLSALAADRATHPDLRRLGALMVAQHRAELRLMRDWWRGWFGGEVPALAPVDRRRMEDSMPSHAQLLALRDCPREEFDPRFVAVMEPHHRGAIHMADRLLDGGRDPRVRALARSIRHTQIGQIEQMRRTVTTRARGDPAAGP